MYLFCFSFFSQMVYPMMNSLGEARKRFKTYVNILSTIKNKNNEKYLILRKRYFNECPLEGEQSDDLDLLGNPELLQSPGSRSGISEHDLAASGRLFNEFQSMSPQQELSPYKEPPPYKPPPKVMLRAYQNQEKYGECVDEFKSALHAIGCRQNKFNDNDLASSQSNIDQTDVVPRLPPKNKSSNDDANYSKQQMLDLTPTKSISPVNISKDSNSNDARENKENITEHQPKQNASDTENTRTLDKQISVKEATKKFNRIASEEEANKIISPTAKKKPEKVSLSVCYNSMIFLS